jgi:nucleotide-binding universal stress UspA family protein
MRAGAPRAFDCRQKPVAAISYDAIMFKHILVPVDDSPLATKAAKYAASLARSSGSRITAVHVIPEFRPPAFMDGVIPYPELYSPDEYRKSTERYARKLLDKVEAIAKKARVKCNGVFVTDDDPWRAIIKTAKRQGCDVIVMASHGRRGLAAVVLGSETTKVLTHSKVPVLVCR